VLKNRWENSNETHLKFPPKTSHMDNVTLSNTFTPIYLISTPSSLLFLAQIILLYSTSSILPKNMQLTPNLGINCSSSNKAHKKCKKV